MNIVELTFQNGFSFTATQLSDNELKALTAPLHRATVGLQCLPKSFEMEQNVMYVKILVE